MVNKELKKNSKIRTVNMMIQSALIIILIVLVANMMVEIKNLQGTARVINYAGLVRGATQRAVKLEVIEYLQELLELYVILYCFLQSLRLDFLHHHCQLWQMQLITYQMQVHQ